VRTFGDLVFIGGAVALALQVVLGLANKGQSSRQAPADARLVRG